MPFTNQSPKPVLLHVLVEQFEPAVRLVGVHLNLVGDTLHAGRHVLADAADAYLDAP